jgi:hypothetical protein
MISFKEHKPLLGWDHLGDFMEPPYMYILIGFLGSIILCGLWTRPGQSEDLVQVM